MFLEYKFCALDSLESLECVKIGISADSHVHELRHELLEIVSTTIKMGTRVHCTLDPVASTVPLGKTHITRRGQCL